VLAHEREGDGGGEAAERARVGAGVYQVPCARVGEAGLVDDMLESFLRNGRIYSLPFQRIETWRQLSLPSRAQGFLGEGIGCGEFLAESAVERWCCGLWCMVCVMSVLANGKGLRLSEDQTLRDFRAPKRKSRWAGLAGLPALQTKTITLCNHGAACR
jgi:hypothetical protein